MWPSTAGVERSVGRPLCGQSLSGSVDCVSDSPCSMRSALQNRTAHGRGGFQRTQHRLVVHLLTRAMTIDLAT